MKNKKFKIAILISHNDENRVRKKKESKKLLCLIIETLYGTGIITKTHIHPIGSGGKPLKKRKRRDRSHLS